MALPAVQLLCLEQGDRSLEQHTSDFLQLACLTYFPDRSLCIYYRTGLSERSKARIPAGGPTEDFAAYVEWVLVNNHSQFTIGPAEDDTSTTPHPETNHPPSTTCTMEKREPTADRGDRPARTIETEPEERTEGVVAPGCEPLGVSDQVREPVTSCAVEGVLVEFEGWEESPDHNNTTVDGIVITTETFLDLLDVFEEVNSPCLVSPLVPSSSELFVSPLVPSSSELFVSPLVPSSSELSVSPLVPSSSELSVSPLVPSSSELSVSPLVPSSSELSVSPLVLSSSELSVPLLVLSSPVFPPNLPLPPPQTISSSLPPLVPFSLSSTPSRKRMDPTRCFRPPVSPWTEVLLAPSPAFESNTPPRPVDASPSPWLLPPSAPPDTLSLKTPPGSLVPQAPTWSDIVQPAPTVSPGSSFPPSPPSSSVAPPPSQSSGSRISPRMLVVPAPARSPDPAVSVGLSGIPTPPGSPSSVASPSAVPRVAPLISPRWCSSSSTPPWGLIMVGLWTNIWLLLLQASPWLLPPSTPPWTIFGFYGLLCISSFASRPPPEPPPPPSSVGLHTARGRAYPEGGDMLHVLCPVT
ncbi:hypothetical protein DPX16_2307 [Anabarilius grahami]|uniref:Uncharacterized protein n=1 Tax=Anabarilius grahami TaxID=495550 RepID=A0A3N0Z3B9_ANAGA|nr:hypothetical protein DPX16_2307 [Anabarilius grahami]